MQFGTNANERIGGPPSGGSRAAGFRDVATRAAHKVLRMIAIWHDRRMMADELNSLDDRTLAELGLARDQIPLLVRAYPAATERFAQMLARVGLDTKAAPLDPATRGDLYRVCTMCTKRGRCRRWLASTKAADGYPAFCPNARMFGLLLEAQRQART